MLSGSAKRGGAVDHSPRPGRARAQTAALPHRDERDLRYVLMTLAALNGHSELSAVIDDLDDEETCPRYAAHLWGASGDADS
ncbi:hypothetical protein RHCRD62_40046 [Rhodococcus sp. RD6.2]|uniref:hypothetical protein n=1 Tax=Rhodococcus sp. RD6.2 TaxID=260936 RepID=UPI00063B1D71|nr:hypothetical protein [Rhodococcus sp. RD6.2]CRK52159.1 hypothetical protein RHCRD62_40046 [Rhodococcus sp. RD6.2]